MNIFDFAFNTTVTAGRNHFKLSVSCRSKAQRLAIVGPSGSGKSPNLAIIGGAHAFAAWSCFGEWYLLCR